MWKPDKYITDLLHQYDCVIIPGLGGFIGNYHPAHIKLLQQMVEPPSKKIVFNSNLKNNDGLLAFHIASEENITFEEAVRKISEFVDDVFSKFALKQTVIIDGVGKLNSDKENNLLFEPENEINFQLESFGLEPVHALSVVKKEIHKHEVKFKDKVVRGNTAEKTNRTKKSIGKKIISGAIIIPVIAALIWIPLKTNLLTTGELSLKSNAPRLYQQRATVVPYSDNEKNMLSVNAMDDSGKGYINIKLSESTDKSVVVKINSEPSVIQPDATEVHTSENNATFKSSTNKKGYYVIGGCFEVEDNAIRFASDLKRKGFSTAILDKRLGRLHPVSYGWFETKEEAIKALQKIKQENSEAWILPN